MGQERLRVNDGIVTGTTLSSVSADFESAQVDAGDVVLVANTPCEVIARLDVNTLTISLSRERTDEVAIPPGDGSGLEIVIRTFAPQVTLIHDQLMRMIGIDADDPGNELSEVSVISQEVMVRLEILGALRDIYLGAISIVGDNEGIKSKANEYSHRFKTACRSATVLIDIDGDGFSDVRKSLGVVWYTRV